MEKTFSAKVPETLSDLHEKGEELIDEVYEDIEEREKQTTPKLNKPTKEAESAKNEKIFIGGIETILTGINQVIKAKIPEFEHDKVEIKTLSTLTVPVLKKYYDLDALQYAEEMKLISYLLACEMDKVDRFIQRRKSEIKEKQDSEKNKKDKFASGAKGETG